MFKDYYAILDTSFVSTQDEIKSAFKKQALKWHPDRNKEQDANLRMQNINEAYLILKDVEAKTLYDKEYKIFKNYNIEQQENKYSSDKTEKQNSYEYSDYEIQDETLYTWTQNAKNQAFDLAKLTLDELLGMTTAGVKAAVQATKEGLAFQAGCLIFVGILLLIILILGGIK